MRLLSRAALAAVALLGPAAAVSADNWPQFRGPRGLGLSAETGLPVKWSATSNVRWKTALPGPGHSSPIVWGDRIFLTAYRGPGRLQRMVTSTPGQLLVLALDKASGRVLWEREVAAERIEGHHSSNAPASPTPATDGRYLFVYFGSRGLICFDFEGRKVWEKLLGPFPNEWGSASSPVLSGDTLLLNCDTDGEDFLLALNKNTGQTIWRANRAGATRAWPTPFVWNAGGRDEVVVSGSRRVKSYDLRTGRELWTADGLTQWVTPTPVAAHGLLYVASNGPGGNAIMAIRPGGAVAWRYDRSAPYSSSPVVVGDYLYAVKNGGVMNCLNAKTGELVWQERLPARGDYFASLVAADGKVYALSEEGEATVLAAKPSLEVLGSNRLGERCMASPAISDGKLYIRSDNTLYCIGQ